MSAPEVAGHWPVEQAWREERARIVATLARRLGDLELAQDAVQEAFAAAVVRWPVDGRPERPGAWLTTTAWRKALDVVRRDRFPLAGQPSGGDAGIADAPVAEWLDDDLLALVLTCCHPALSLEARVALTLRHVAGLSAAEIAAAFLIPEATMEKRLVRARAKIKQSGIRFGVPERDNLAERLSSVHAVLYLIFTAGHQAAGPGPAVRADLCEEAVWLAQRLHSLVPADAETGGLLALLLVHNARLGSRATQDGRLVPFTEQDRTQWDGAAVERARGVIAANPAGQLGPYQVEAAIALLHATAGPQGVNWPRVADLYSVLSRIAPSEVVEVNRAVAVGHADGPNAGLAVLDPILRSGRLDGYAATHAAHADLLAAAGDSAGAAAAWQRAAELSLNPQQRTELERRAQLG